MNKRKIGIAVVVLAALAAGLLLFKRMLPSKYVPADDEIALHIQLDTEEDIGLLVFDYRADEHEYSGGISNANKLPMKRNSDDIIVWNKQELCSSSDAVDLSIQLRIITEYIDPNFENIYPEDVTKYTEPISWRAEFGKLYFITISGDKVSGYQAVLN